MAAAQRLTVTLQFASAKALLDLDHPHRSGACTEHVAGRGWCAVCVAFEELKAAVRSAEQGASERGVRHRGYIVDSEFPAGPLTLPEPIPERD